MSTLYVQHAKHAENWRELFTRAAPELRALAWPAPVDPESVDYLVTWNPPEDFYRPYSKLKAVFAMGAGIDGFLARPDLSPEIPLIRLNDAGMAEQMVEYALLAVLFYQRRVLQYRELQAAMSWRPLGPRTRAEVRVGVLGLGTIGSAVAGALSTFGYAVSGWSRTAKQLIGIHTLSGPQALPALLASSDVLINVLPSTVETRGLLGAQRLAQLPRGAYVVNCARGDQLAAEALVALLDQGHLSGALLDVFAVEPLPADSALWCHPKITITPHIAARTLPEASVAQIVGKIRQMARGEPVDGVVSRELGY